MAAEEIGQDETTESFRAGRRVGFGIAALVLSLVGFLSLLGAEKAILAIVLGVLAIRGSGPGSLARRLGVIAICLATLFLVTMVVVVIVFHSQVIQFLQMLQKLS